MLRHLKSSSGDLASFCATLNFSNYVRYVASKATMTVRVCPEILPVQATPRLLHDPSN